MQDLLGARTFTNREKIEALEREIKLRRYVYARKVSEKRMKQETADREIATFESILADYQGKS